MNRILTNLPRAVLFDHDGVLVRSEPLHWAAWRRLLPELGLPYEEAELRARVGKTAPEILADLLDRHKPGWSDADYDVHALAVRKNEFYLELTRTTLTAYPGVPELLRWLRERGVRTAVVSNARRRELDAALRLLSIETLFDLVLSRDDVAKFKPDPLPYLTAAAQLGIAPGKCLGVEDSNTGLEALLLAPIPAAAVLTNFSREALETPVPGRPDLHPTWIGASILELAAWLKTLPELGQESE